MQITFVPMNEQQYEKFLAQLLKEYAEENIEAGVWNSEQAEENARRQIEQLVPEGLITLGHIFFIVVDKELPVGTVWLNIQEDEKGKQGFIYDLKIAEEYQGNGYGKAVLKELDNYAAEESISQIGLHVFAHNKRAINLYQSAGYELKSYNMAKTFID